jgi:hypothetical protein
LAAAFGQARKQAETFVHRAPHGSPALGAVAIAAQAEIFRHRHGGEQLALFRHQRQALRHAGFDVGPGQIGAAENHPALARQHAHDGAQQRGFAGAVRADHRDDAPGADGEGKIGHRRNAAIGDRQVGYGQQAHATPPR